MTDILQGLNEFQKDAVTTTEGPLLVLAGAGSGKTKVITHRIAYLISLGVPEDAILALTFTNKAAGEMKTRIGDILGGFSSRLWVSTFHSFGARILRTEYKHTTRDKNFTIFDTTDVKRALKIILEKLELTKVIDVKNAMYSISTIKNKFMDQDQVRNEFYNSRIGEYIAKIYVEYERYLAQNNAYDFDDLLHKMVSLFKNSQVVREKYEERFSYLMIDEFQDTNSSQLELVKLLTQNNNNICIVGDEDQSIYQWRGAEVQNILNFPKMYKDTKTIDLKYNYRCGSEILNCAISLIENNTGRFDKTIIPVNKDGEKVKYFQSVNDDDGVDHIIDEIISYKDKGVELDEIAVIYRTNAQSRILEKKFKGKIPYKIIGSMYFYERKEIKDLLSFLQVLENRNNNIAVLRVIDNLYRGIGKTTIQKLIDISFNEGLSLFDTIKDVDTLSDLRKGTVTKLKNIYADIIKYFDIVSEPEVGFNNLITTLFEEHSYILETEQKARESHDDSIIDRIENMKEFRNELLEYNFKSEEPTLTGFLEDITLQMQAKNSGERCVNFLTLHSSKGLEYNSVFIYGVEDGLIPLVREFDDDVDIQEERRLLYVGMTRAKINLTLIKRLDYPYPGKRTLESRFITELDNNSYENLFSTNMSNKENEYGYDDGYYNRRQSRSSFGESYTQREEKKEATATQGVATIGDRVVHKIFGMGKIIEIKGDKSDPIVFIDFINVGRKKLKYNLAGLKQV